MIRTEATSRAGYLLRAWIAPAAVLLLGACTHFQETHFLKSVPANNQVANYFRLQVTGWTGLSSARYISGYFDETVVNQYFNEIGQPQKGTLVPVGQAPSEPATSGPGAAAQGGSAAKTPSLVLLLSSNSDEIANQLGALSQSQDFTAALASLAASSKFDAARTAASRQGLDTARGHSNAQLGDQLVSSLSTSATQQEIYANLLAYVNALAADLGNEVPFINLDDAAVWLRVHGSSPTAAGGGS